MTERAKKQSRAPSRADMRFMGFHVPSKILRQVRRLAFEHETTNQALLIEFVKDGLNKYGVNVEDTPHMTGEK